MTDLSDLIVFKYLKVHGLKVEPRRVSATYTLVKSDGEIVSNTLMYTYDQDVFGRRLAQDLNLASVMCVQVAINYGLFCKELIFEGLFDDNDEKLIRDMTENTAREIYVNKILQPNVFLKPSFRDLSPEHKDHYSAASIRFESGPFSDIKWTSEKAETHNDHYAILSSGGKDSLLSYGLLKEFGTPHPVYVNESGRHWYTAYNAFHYMEKNEPLATRVWCNSDRIFNWMVRHMPFIRENFQDIRADIYPIRLWTVAVFLFGVLPVARRRQIKHIIIGNEYDTTMRQQYEGITHYAALYDQSKYFDNLFTRYYKRKGWNMLQYSLLRSLSELLILKILVKRYPDLQRVQVSCHAAHKSEDRMWPCGQCEKCRRIVGMLKSLNEDPARCGYTPIQISNCLKALESKKVKQIGSDAQHLYHLLLSNGLIETNDSVKKFARANREIMSLRFDQERSRMEDIPPDIRKSLFEILEQYADGVMKRADRKWSDAVLDEKDLNLPHFLDK